MNLSPLPIQKFFDNNGRPLDGGLLFTYAAGTNNKIATYVDSTGGTPNANPIILDFRGECRLWIDPALAYKFVLARRGDTDPPGSPIWTVNDIRTGITAEYLTQQIIGEILFPQTPAEVLAGVVPTNFAYPQGDVRRYGALLDGTTDDSLAWQRAINVAEAEAGGMVTAPAGESVIGSGLIVDSDGVTIEGASRDGTMLLAGSGSISMLRIASSYCAVKQMKFDGNSQSAVTAIRIADVNESQTTVVTVKNFNTFRDIWINGVAEGIVLKPGPDVAGADSQLFYNSFENIHIQGSTRGIWLREGTNAGASGPNRNFFRGIRIGQSGSNTGIQLDSGDTNMFSQVSLEGITTGASPNAIPTALKIADVDANGASLLYNTFVQCFWEACTRDLENSNVYSQFYACFPAAAKTVWTIVPHVFIGGYLATDGPMQRIHGYLFQSNSEVAGAPDDVAYFPAGAAVPAASGVRWGAGGPLIVSGSGSPEGAVSAPPGSIFLRTDGNGGTAYYFKEAGSSNTGWRANGYLQGSASYDPPSLADGAATNASVTVTGAGLGDFAEASFSLDMQGITMTAEVTAANTVTCYLRNESGVTVDLASGTLRARVWPQ